MRSSSVNIWSALYTGLSLIWELLVLEKGGELGVGVNKSKKMNVILKWNLQ